MQNLEIERKFLIKLPDCDYLTSREGCTIRHMTQTYLIRHDKDVERRTRKVEEGQKTVYYYTEKVHRSSLTRYENESEITSDEYNELLSESYSRLTKTRYSFPYNGHVIEIDVYPYDIGGDAMIGLAVLEVELQSEREKFDIPAEIEVIRELTGTHEFSNKTLAKRI